GLGTPRGDREDRAVTRPVGRGCRDAGAVPADDREDVGGELSLPSCSAPMSMFGSGGVRRRVPVVILVIMCSSRRNCSCTCIHICGSRCYSACTFSCTCRGLLQQVVSREGEDHGEGDSQRCLLRAVVGCGVAQEFLQWRDG